jgi:hypothetical protein
VCSDQLQVTQLGCRTCGTGLTGNFRPCEFCQLDDGERELLRVFLAARGNMKELERHLGVSYPTARARFDDLLRTLGLLSDGTGSTPASSAPTSPTLASDPRLETLRAVAEGALDVDAATQTLRRPGRRNA